MLIYKFVYNFVLITDFDMYFKAIFIRVEACFVIVTGFDIYLCCLHDFDDYLCCLARLMILIIAFVTWKFVKWFTSCKLVSVHMCGLCFLLRLSSLDQNLPKCVPQNPGVPWGDYKGSVRKLNKCVVWMYCYHKSDSKVKTSIPRENFITYFLI